jgi:PAS domain S-box-containing protein
VIESALDSVIVVDEAGRVVALNPAAVATFGYAPSEALGRDIGALIVPDHLRASHAAGMERYRQTREPHVLGRRVEMPARHKDGHLIPVELAITEVVLPGGRLFTANLRDSRPAQAAAREIERQREALHQSEKLSAIGSLLAGVAHELNNPLTIALGEAALLVDDLEERGEQGPVADRVRRIHDATGRCAKVVRSFLSIVRRRPPQRRAVDLPPLVAAAVDLLAHGLRTVGIEVRNEVPGQAPAVLADADQVQQIVVNLLVNAIQALEMSPPPRRLTLSLAQDAAGLRLRVADNGPGIPHDIAERIFEPFFSTKPEGVGTGIGLPVSRDLAAAQDGELRLVASGGPGAAFELCLPLAETGEGGERSARPSGAERPLRLLIVDDELEIAEVLADGLGLAGHTCVTAGGGRAAQRAIEEGGDFDAIVCDLRMPDLDGPAFYRWLKERRPEMAAATIFMTGDALGQMARRFLGETGRPVLEKPFAPADLVRALQALA